MRARSMQVKCWAIVATLSIGVSLACQESSPPAPAETEVESALSAFEPPADGKLTEDQVRTYVSAREQSVRPETELPAGADGGELLAALQGRSPGHVEAARQLGYDPDEYRWVQARIMEAQLPLDAKLGDLATGMSAAALEGLEKQRDAATDPDEKARLAEQIAALEAHLGGGDTRSREGIDPAARAHNRELLESHLARAAAAEAAQ